MGFRLTAGSDFSNGEMFCDCPGAGPGAAGAVSTGSTGDPVYMEPTDTDCSASRIRDGTSGVGFAGEIFRAASQRASAISVLVRSTPAALSLLISLEIMTRQSRWISTVHQLDASW